MLILIAIALFVAVIFCMVEDNFKPVLVIIVILAGVWFMQYHAKNVSDPGQYKMSVPTKNIIQACKSFCAEDFPEDNRCFPGCVYTNNSSN